MKHIMFGKQTIFGLGICAATMLSCAAFSQESNGSLSGPVKGVYEQYIAIQKALANDSMKGVDEHANAIAAAARGAEGKELPADTAKQAEAVAKAKDIKAARQAFKPLSASLVKYLGDNKAAKGVYHEAYCPMAKASWLQTEKEVRNPYYGKSMLDCGELKN